MSDNGTRKIESAVITGATGTIGTALVNLCISKRIKVIVLANPASKRLDRIPQSPYVSVIPCALNELGTERIRGKIEGLLKKNSEKQPTGHFMECAIGQTMGQTTECAIGQTAEQRTGGLVFFHLAWAGTYGEARNDYGLQEDNLRFAIDALKLAKSLGCHTFVGAGSQAEYGRVSGVLGPDISCNPENGYGIYKLKAEETTRKLADELGIVHIWPRVLSVYGPCDGERTMVMSTISKLLSGEVPSLTKGEQLWDFLFCEDAARAFLDLAGQGKSGQVYPLGSGQSRPLRDYIEIIRDEIDPSLELGFGQVSYSDKQVMHLEADISRLTADTGFVPQVSFREGIKKTIEWVRAERNCDNSV